MFGGVLPLYTVGQWANSFIPPIPLGAPFGGVLPLYIGCNGNISIPHPTGGTQNKQADKRMKMKPRANRQLNDKLERQKTKDKHNKLHIYTKCKKDKGQQKAGLRIGVPALERATVNRRGFKPRFMGAQPHTYPILTP